MRNLGLKNFLESHDINVIETPVGDKNIYTELKSLETQRKKKDEFGLGGEQSGHIILLDDEHNTGDGIRTALFVIQAFKDSCKNKFSEFVTDLGRTPQIIASAYVGQGKRLTKEELEALSLQTKKGKDGLAEINLRYSGTEPLFRAMLQSNGSINEKELASIAVNICSYIQQIAGSNGSEIDILNCTQGGIIHC